MNTSTNNLNNDLGTISNREIQLAMSFNPYPSKEAQEVIFSRKHLNSNHDSIYFNHNSIQQVPFQKHLEIYLHISTTD